MEALVGTSTLLLALFTAALAFAAFRQMRQTNMNEQRRFEFEMYRLAEAETPIVVANFKMATNAATGLLFSNVGTGPAVNIRFSGFVEWSETVGKRNMDYTAAQRSVSAIGVSGSVEVITKHNFERIAQLLIRYEDIYGNTYSTEYRELSRENSWYVWRKPHLGKTIGLDRPLECSEDHPSWGFQSRQYYDALKGLW